MLLATGVLGSLGKRPAFAREDAEATPSLCDLAGNRFTVGTAAMSRHLADPRLAELITHQFNSFTPENEMKPISVHPRPGEWNFDAADRIADFTTKHEMQLIGHTLCWHQQSPRFLFESEQGEPLPRDQAIENLREHVQTVADRYRGKVQGWDVVNEAVDDGGPYLRDTPALQAIGEDFLPLAFKFAREADPDAKLLYNDYNIDQDYKRPKTLRLLEALDKAGQRPDAVGIQAHWLLNSPSLDEIERGLKTYIDAGYEVHLTELDVDPLPRRGAGADLNAAEQGQNPYPNGLPPEMSGKLAERYRQLFDLILKHEKHIGRVTFWGIHDGLSWLNGFPVRGRTNHPLLFDRDLKPKPAFDAVADVLG